MGHEGQPNYLAMKYLAIEIILKAMFNFWLDYLYPILFYLHSVVVNLDYELASDYLNGYYSLDFPMRLSD